MMEIRRLGAAGKEMPVLQIDGEVSDLRDVTKDLDANFFATQGLDRALAAHAKGELLILAAAHSFRVGAPLVRPGAVLCNGAPRQDSNAADMILSDADLAYHLSQCFVFERGSPMNTRTPKGVALSGRFAYLEADDVMEVGVDGLGAHRQNSTSASIDAAGTS